MWRKLKRISRSVSRGAPPAQEAGVVLLVVLWSLALLSVVVLAWVQEWRMELQLTANFREQRRCRHLAEAGIYWALGKMVEAKMAGPPRSQTALEAPKPTWKADQTPYLLELNEGVAEIRVADEAGKINLNVATEETLMNLFSVLGHRGQELQTMVAAILDWRDRDSLTRMEGAEGDYYLRLDPPYPAKDGFLDIVEELAWVRGFGGKPLSRLSQWLTAQGARRGVNLNTAPQEVLQALGFTAEQALGVIQARQAAPLRNLSDLPGPLPAFKMARQEQTFAFQPSDYFTIVATGMGKSRRARYTIKAIVRLHATGQTPWELLYWLDDYPE